MRNEGVKANDTSMQTSDLRRSVCITAREDLTARTLRRYLGITIACTGIQ